MIKFNHFYFHPNLNTTFFKNLIHIKSTNWYFAALRWNYMYIQWILVYPDTFACNQIVLKPILKYTTSFSKLVAKRIF